MLSRINRVILLAALLLNVVPIVSIAEEAYSKYGVTLGDPWLGVKYTPISLLSLELRTTLDPEVKINFLRANYIFQRKYPLQLFAGLEYGMIKFDMSDISGSGTMVTPFFGAEYSINHNIALATDFGPSFINLKSDNVSLSGPEYTFNIWLILYPFSKEVKKPEGKIENPIPVKTNNQKIAPKQRTTLKTNIKRK